MPIRRGIAVKARVVGAGDPVVDGLPTPGLDYGYRTIGQGPRQAAPGTLATPDYLVGTATALLAAERLPTNTATVSWDMSTPGQFKANVIGGGGGPAPATTVTSETTYGISPAVGLDTTYARAGHTHGSPTAPTAASVGAVPTTRAIATTGGIVGGGDLSADRSFSLTYGTLANTVTQGDDARLSDARTPAGAAGGQLGGTYPNPDVRGIRETAGPTMLTLGAVADGQMLKRVGSTLIGVTLTFTLAFSGDPQMEPSGQQLSAGRST